MFTFLCFPMSFLSYSPPQKKLSSLLLTASFAHIFLPVCIFLSSSSFTLKLSLQLQLASCPTSLSPICHILHTVPSSFCCCGTKHCRKMSSSALRGSGRFGRASEPWRNLQQQLLPACGCRDTQYHKSVLPLDLEDFVRVISGEIICSENICCHTISEQSRKKGSSSPQIVSL